MNKTTQDMKSKNNILRTWLRGAAVAALLLAGSGAAQAQSVTIGGHVFGGGNNAPVGKGTTVVIDQTGATITGDVYGGGALAEVDTVRKRATLPAVTTGDSIVVRIMQGTINGNVYGGGLGNADTAAHVYGPVFVSIGDTNSSGGYLGSASFGSTSAIFGCNNINGSPKDNVRVDIWQTAHGNTYATNLAPTGNGIMALAAPTDEFTAEDVQANSATQAYAIAAVYGGGNRASYIPVASKSTTVTIHSCVNTIKDVYGGGNAADVGNNDTNANTNLVVWGGRIKRVFGGGNGEGVGNPGANIRGTANTDIHGGLIDMLFGGSNSRGDVNTIDLAIDHTGTCEEAIVSLFGGANEANITGDVTMTLGCGAESFVEVYGGSNKANITGDVTLNVYGGTIGNVFGGSKGIRANGAILDTAANITGNVTLNLYGGHITNAFGGSNAKGNITGSITVNVQDAEAENCELDVTNIYGAGNLTAYTPDSVTIDAVKQTPVSPIVNINHIKSGNSIHGDVFGGGLGETAEVTSNPVVNIGDVTSGHLSTITGRVFGGGSAAPVSGSPTVNVYNGTAPTVHGGGLGSTATVTGNPTVIVNKTPAKNLTLTSVYGGGDAAPVTGNTTVTLTAGTLTNAFGGGNVADVTGTTNVTLQGATVTNVYGGGNEANVSSTSTVALTSGNVTGGLYGGCNTSGNVGEAVVTLTGGTVGTAFVEDDPETGEDEYADPITADVFGGGLGQATKVLGNVTVTIGTASNDVPPVYSGTATIYGDVYGGSAKGLVNCNEAGTARNGEAKTDVILNHGTIYGDLYGGGLGQAPDYAANVWGPVTVTVNGGRMKTYMDGIYQVGGRVLGCNNYYGAPQVSTVVDIKGGVIEDDVFGGGNLANATIATHVIVEGGEVDEVYGGGAYASTGATLVDIHGGATRDIYGGCLGGSKNDVEYSPAVNGTATVNIGSGTVNLSTGFSTSTTGNATISGSIYGGNNAKGSPTGIATVNIYKTAHNTTNAATYLVNDGENGDPTYAIMGVYGGGNVADFIGTSSHINVYGCDNTIERVFGGGNAASTNTLYTMIQGGRMDQVFGGGNGYISTDDAADVHGDVNLSIHGGNIRQVFGAGNEVGVISGAINLTVDGNGPCTTDTLTVDEFFGGSNLANLGTAQNPVTLNTTIGCKAKFNSLYGGCNLADITGNVTLNITGSTMTDVYAGSKGLAPDNSDPENPIAGKAANISGNVTLNLYGGKITNAFGGSNINGNIGGKITVNVTDTSTCRPLNITNVYGASNLAAYHPTTAGAYPEVNINKGTVSGDVFGGGLGATAKVYSNPVVTVGDVASGHESYVATVSGNVYGGGSAAMVGDDELATASTNGTTVLIQKANSTVANVIGGGKAAGVTGTTSVTLANGTVSTALYGGCYNSGVVGGDITVTLTGGTVGSALAPSEGVYGGGFGEPTQTRGDVTVTLGSTTVYGDLYGGSALGDVNASTSNTTTLNINGSNLHGTIFGGGKGQDSPSTITAYTNGNVLVNYNTTNSYLAGIYGGANINGSVAGDIEVNVLAYVGASGNGNSRDVFGGGLGANTSTNGDVTVTIGDGSHSPTLYGDVYGGSSLGEVGASSKIAKVDLKAGTLNGTIYGGGKGQVSPSSIAATVTGGTEVDVSGGTVTGGLYGGGNINGSVAEAITVSLTGGTVGVNGTTENAVFGGGLGAHTTTGSNVTVTLDGATVYGALYGGSALGSVNDAVAELTTVHVLSGEIHGNVYGGGLGKAGAGAADSGQVNGTITVNIGATDNDKDNPSYTGSATIDGSVYGCNNTNGSPQGDVTVNIYSTAHTTTPIDNTTAGTAYAINNVFGGGRNASFTTTGKKAYVNVFTCYNTIGTLYGGGDAADVPGSAVTIWGGRFDKVFGGGNGAGVSNPGANIGAGGITIAVHGGNIGTLVNASNEKGSIGGSINVTVDNEGGCDEEVDEFFGGSNMVDITGDVTTTIECGAGTFGAVYGGSNKADITGSVSLTIQGGTIGRVFGGSKGDLSSLGGGHSDVSADISGDVTLTLNGGTIGAAFGGSNINGTIGGAITVNVTDLGGTCPLAIDSVFGAGNLTAYTGSPVVNINHGTVGNLVYGVVFGGGKGATAIVTGSPVVTIGDNTAAHRAIVTGSVFGGGDAAAVTGNTTVTYNDNNADSYVGYLYGGGNNIVTNGVSGSTTVTLTAGRVTSGIYGGCNEDGTVGGNSTVNLNGGQVGASASQAEIFGGGYGASTEVSGNVQVTMGNAAGTYTPTIYGELYGGSALGNVNTNGSNTTTVDILSGTLNGIIYGGGRGRKQVGTLGDEGYVAPVAALVNGVVHVNVGAQGTPADPLAVPPVPAGDPSGSANLRYATIYGCNNLNGSPQHDVYVDIYQTAHTTTDAEGYTADDRDFAISYVYGGGNQADYAPSNSFRKNVDGLTEVQKYPHYKKTHVTVHGCENTINEAYGGGNAAAVLGDSIVVDGGRHGIIFGGGNGAVTAANVGLGGVSLTAKGGRVGWIYEHCNKRGIITGPTSFVNHGGDADCRHGVLKVDYHFCGGNEVDIAGDFVYKFTCDQNLDYLALYGGCRLGTTYGNITLIIEGGTFSKIYGGPRGDKGFAASVKKYPTDAQLEVDYVKDGSGNYISDATYKYQLKPENELVYAKGVHEYMYTKADPSVKGTGGNVTIILKGGTIGRVYGGCELNGNVEGKITIVVDSLERATCPLDINNIYGASDLAQYHPDDSTWNTPLIALVKGHVNNDVFGGGHGSDSVINAGLVTACPRIMMGDYKLDTAALRTSYTQTLIPTVASDLFWVKGNIYGGGEMASVGKYTRDENGHPTACDDNTGLTTITITKGKVGPNVLKMPDFKGHVFGGSKGAVGDTNSLSGKPKISHLAFVNNTDVTISGTAFIKGSVYGGGESGRVLHDTYVKIQGGQIGCGWDASQATDAARDLNRVYTSAEWDYNVVSNASQYLYECNHWDFGDGSSPKNYNPYDPYETGYTTGYDGHTYYGNVFGGGSGFMPFKSRNKANTADSSIYIASSGRVFGSTKVEVTGGHILTSLYGGCELGDVTGDSSVVIFGGTATLGVPRTLAQIAAHPVTCYLFGAGKGDERVRFNKNTNVQNVRVTVNGGKIYGSIFGGGEDGHVMRNVKVDVLTGANIGTWGTSYVDGNVFGGGRGFSGNALTAGNVAGDVEVNIKGGTMLGSIYGGGRLASVGYGLYLVTEEGYGIMRDDNKNDLGNTVPNFPRGHITVNISGGTIGNENNNSSGTLDYRSDHPYGGNVFGGSMGRLTKLDKTYILDLWHKLGAAKQTEVNISGNAWVKGNVYGGSELGLVTENTKVNISGASVRIGRDVSGTLYHGNVYGGGYGSVALTPEQLPSQARRDSVPVYSGRTYGSTELNLTNGTIYGSVFGGGERASIGYAGNASLGNTTVNIGATDGEETPTYSGDVTIHGNVYGANNFSGTPLGNVNVNIYSTAHNTTNAATYTTNNGSGAPTFALANVFGGGHEADYSPILNTGGGTTSDKVATVHVYGCDNTIEDLFSGGDAAAAYGVVAIIDGGRFSRVFGGGNGEESAANIGAGGTDLHVYGGIIDSCFGGGNKSGTISGTVRTEVDFSRSSCPMDVEEFFGGSNAIDIEGDLITTIRCGSFDINEIYGGSNKADITGNVTLNVYGGTYNYVFGGSKGDLSSLGAGHIDKAANITGNVNLNLYGGDIGSAFGGGNVNGVINGVVTVTVDSTQPAPCRLDLDYVFGGGRLAQVNDPAVTSPIVNLTHGHVNNEVYGGGLGDLSDENAGKVTANPQVNMTGADFHVKGSIYGGGSIAVTDGSTEVNMFYGTVGAQGSAATNGNVYGGGRGDNSKIWAGGVKGNTSVKISHGRVWHNVYGGGSLASVGTFTYGAVDRSTKSQQITSCAEGTGLATVYISGGIIGNDGHENGMVFGSSRGDIDTILARQDTMAWAYATKVTIGDTTADHNMTSPQIKGSVYGGGENGHVKQNAYVHIYSGQVGYQSDSPSDKKKNVDKSDPTYEFRGNVYGSGCGTDKFFVKDSVAQLKIGGVIQHLEKDGGYHLPSAADHSEDSIFKVREYNMYAGVVQGNVRVKISGGHIFHNVYGGGAMANVGSISSLVQYKDMFADGSAHKFGLSYPNNFTFVEPTGYVHIDITGGRIGTMGSYDGDVFGGARGEAGDRFKMARYGNVRTAVININMPTVDAAYALDTFDVHECITGSVYGGAENGHINDSTFVTLTNGLVGHALYGGGKGKGEYITHELIYQKNNADGVHLAEDDSTATIFSLTAGKVYGNTRVVMNGGHVVRNIYGGGNQGSVGKGNYHGGSGDYCSAGYGERLEAGDTATWLPLFRSSGTSTVIVNDGTVGLADPTIKDSLPYGNVFGGCRGTAAPNVRQTLSPRVLYYPIFFAGYSNRTRVIIGDGTTTPRIYGSVYGGGMDGHVRWGTHVTVKSGEIGLAYNAVNQTAVGTDNLDSKQWFLRGSVYGAGSGMGQYEATLKHTTARAGEGGWDVGDDSVGYLYSSSAGSVTHFTRVDIEGGTIHNNVYGGGSLASVGPPMMGQKHNAPIDSSLSVINISGGTIGTFPDVVGYKVIHHDAVAGVGEDPEDPGYVAPVAAYDETVHYSYGGKVFGGSRGQIDVDNASFSTVVWTQVNLSGGQAYGSVYGGGEVGTIKEDAYVNVSGGIVGPNVAVKTTGPGGDSLSCVYGGGKGIGDDPSGTYKTFTNVNNTHVAVSGGRVCGSVFGGAEDGHVLGNTNVSISNTVASSAYAAAHDGVDEGDVLSIPIIGTGGYTHEYDGCVLGGGRNALNKNASAGRVQGNTNVTVTGGRIMRTILGGGALARVGVNVDGVFKGVGAGNDTISFKDNSGNYDSINHGTTFVQVSGDTLLVPSANFGNVFVDGRTYRDIFFGTTVPNPAGTDSVVYLTTIGAPNGPILVDNDYTIGDIFGGGKGDTKDTVDILAGRVMNTYVTVSGRPRVMADIYAGGEMSSVGWWDTNRYVGTFKDSDPNTNHDKYYAKTGYTHVTITGNPNTGTPYEFSEANIHGGRPWTLIDSVGRLYHTCSGSVYGGGQGYVEEKATHRENWVHMGRVRKTDVSIADGRFMGNIFGGGSRGVVKEDCHVTISGGRIGCEIVDNSNTNNLAGVMFKRYYVGSVFGGGYGNPKKFSHLNDSSFVSDTGRVRMIPTEQAGRVYGNTYVNITGGHIMDCVYGGGDMASTGWVERDPATGRYLFENPAKRHGGLCTVNISGTAVVGPLDGTLMNGHVYGAGKGVPFDRKETYKLCANVNNTQLTVSGGYIHGSTFGGGADCHVLGDVHTTIEAGAIIGSGKIVNTPRGYDGYEEEYDGCVIGGGRNAFNSNHTAGRIQGNAYVTVTGGRIKRSVIGGGALARTGVDVDGLIASFVTENVYDSINHGTTFVNVSGDTLLVPSANFDDEYLNGRTYREVFSGTTMPAATGDSIVYLTTIGAPNGSILVDNDYTIGDIFGGGKGDTKDTVDIMAGRVMNTYVTVTGRPRVMADIYAGAEMASVGWWDTNRYVGTYGTSDLNTNHDKYVARTGYTHVTITGNPNTGTPYEFSTDNYITHRKAWTLVDGLGRLTHTCSGNVYGGGQGYVEQYATHRENWVHMGRVRRTIVTIGDGRFMGNVFGGGSRGVVKEDCHVTITGGRIGCVIHDASEDSNGDPIYVGNQYYYGSVFGGGYGNPKTFSHLNDSSFVTSSGTRIPMIPTEQAGRVYGNTHVNISGGHIMDCIYGGGDMASTGWVDRDSETGAYILNDSTRRHGGVCYVNITGNTIVGPLDHNGHNAYVYGAGKGVSSDPDETYKFCANVNRAHLTVNLTTTGAASVGPDTWTAASHGGRIWGSLFGGGADCHVLGDVHTTLHAGIVGKDGSTSYDGNIFGAGRNYENSNHTNGRVQGNVYVVMDGGTLQGTIFGGGRMALTGVDVDGHFIDKDHGNVDIQVRGNSTIGNSNSAELLMANESVGDIFGAGKGDTKNYEDVWAGRVTNAKITVKDSTTGSPRIHGSVFGGGEMASLGWWDDTIKNGEGTVIFHTKDDVSGSYGTNYGTFYANTGAATISITGEVTIGTYDELTLYTLPTHENQAQRVYNESPYENPGMWTMYNPDGSVLHTCTGNVFGGGQGDVDTESPRWVSMGRSRTSTVTIGTLSDATAGPTIMGCVFGGAEQGIMTGDVSVTINSGTIGTLVTSGSGAVNNYTYGDVYGAGYGCDDESEWGDDDWQSATEPHNDSTAGSQALHLGWNPGLLAGRTFGNATVDVLGGHIRGSVYGGGSFASVGDDKSAGYNATTEQYPINGKTTVNIGSGTVDAGFATAVSGNATIDGNVFGANNYKGTPYGNTEVNIYRTAHTSDDVLTVSGVTVVRGNEYPAGLKALEDPVDELTEEDVASDKLTTEDRLSLGKDSRFALAAVYGGGNLASHTPLDEVNGTTLVHVYKCEENTIKYVYGGGNAAATRNNHVIVDGGRIKNLFGGGDGYSSANNHSDPDGVDYNPGADVLGTATTEIHGGVFDSVYAGSNQYGYVNNSSLTIDNTSGCEELIGNAFGGGNEAVGGGGEITLGCGARYENFYAGANNADIGSLEDWNRTPRVKSNIILNIEGGVYENLFGGNNAGGVIYGDVTVNIHGGQIHNLFGGNNAGGNIMGSIEVNIDFDPDYACADGLRLDNIYGGGRDAAYSPYDPFHASPVVNVKNNRVKLPSNPTTAFTAYTASAPSSVEGHDSAFVKIYDVFGGGLGTSARVTAYPRIVVGGFQPKTEITTPDDPATPEDETVITTLYTRKARVYHNLYGGGSAAPVDGNTTVYVCDATIGTTTDHTYPDGGMVFGGGYGLTSTVQGNTVIGVYGLSEIMNNVYGGGNAGIVTGKTHTEVAFLKQVFPPEIEAFPVIENDVVTAVKANFVIRGMETQENKEFYYTTDGTKPDITNPAQRWDGNPIELTYGNTVHCIATIPGYIPSAMMAPMMPSPDIIIDETDPANPKVSFNSTVGSRVRYTLDGTDPTSSSPVYCVVGETTGTPVALPAESVVKVIAEGQGCETSPVTYLTSVQPTITVEGSTVTITSPHTSDHIVYTTDGSTPVSSMTGQTPHGTHVESNTVTLTDVASGTTIKAITKHRGYMPSQINAVIVP